MVAPIARVLVVEDDVGIADAVVYALERDGMAALRAGTLEQARPGVEGADLVILDLGLPDGSGFTLLREWRRLPTSPRVIVLTSRDEEVDCVAALEAGADDFVTKPFSPRALVARVRAVLRRGGLDPHAEAPPRALTVDRERRAAAYDGHDLELTKIEFDVLDVLASAPGRVHTREQLLSRVWGDGFSLTERTVDSHVKALRRKLAEAGATSLIVAVRGVGFKLAEAPGQTASRAAPGPAPSP
jgi:two-component system catabolic regulation response regulator CreB